MPNNHFNEPDAPEEAVPETRAVADMKGWHAVQSTLLQAVTDSRTVQGVIDAADALFHARLMFKSVAESGDPR